MTDRDDAIDVPMHEPVDEQSVDPAPDGPVSGPRHGVFKRLYHGEANANIVGRWKIWFGVSGVLLLIGIGALATSGLQLGIDFTGGTVWEVKAGNAEVSEIQDAMGDLGYQDVQVQEVTQPSEGTDTRFFRVVAEASAEPSGATTKALDDAATSLRGVRGDVPEAARGPLDRVIDELDAVDGPFPQNDPEALQQLQDEIDALPDTLADAGSEEAKTSTADDAARTMQAHLTDLSNLEDAERARVSGDVTQKLSELTGTPTSGVTVDTVGPSWGEQISNKARTALIVFMVAIMLFITVRFELKMAIATVVGVIHDLLMVVGFYAVFRFPVTPATVVALLTMLGFSIYDGIVVFDRVNENTKLLGSKATMTYTQMASKSLNQVLMRSLNTSITTLLPILSVLVIGAYVLGASTLEEFGLALFIGLLFGTYSSLFIATPLLTLLKEREPRYRDLRAQIAERGHGSVVSDEPEGDADHDPVMASVQSGPRAAVAPGGKPRPRKQGKKR